MGGSHLGIFAKYWEPGKVKTRLAATLGHEVAAAVYLHFVEVLLARFGLIYDSREVAYAPPNRREEFAELAAMIGTQDGATVGDWQLNSQGDGDLGQRMHGFFERNLQPKMPAMGREKVVLIGSDSPTMPESYFGDTLTLLDDHEVVLGPSEDGGYYLVAAKGDVPPIFAGIDWSTDQVWPQTIARLESLRVRYATLPAWYDVDSEVDLRRMMRELKVLPVLDLQARLVETLGD